MNAETLAQALKRPFEEKARAQLWIRGVPVPWVLADSEYRITEITVRGELVEIVTETGKGVRDHQLIDPDTVAIVGWTPVQPRDDSSGDHPRGQYL